MEPVAIVVISDVLYGGRVGFRTGDVGDDHQREGALHRKSHHQGILGILGSPDHQGQSRQSRRALRAHQRVRHARRGHHAHHRHARRGRHARHRTVFRDDHPLHSLHRMAENRKCRLRLHWRPPLSHSDARRFRWVDQRNFRQGEAGDRNGRCNSCPRGWRGPLGCYIPPDTPEFSPQRRYRRWRCRQQHTVNQQKGHYFSYPVLATKLCTLHSRVTVVLSWSVPQILKYYCSEIQPRFIPAGHIQHTILS